MKTGIYLLAIWLISGLMSVALAQTNQPPLSIVHLIGDYYVYTTYRPYNGSPYPSNSMYMVTDKGVVMFDTPWDSLQFQPLLDSIRARHHQAVVLCISTHFHADRTAGLEFLRRRGIATYSSKRTYDLCAEHNEKQSEFYFTNDTTFVIGNHTVETYYPGEGHSSDNIVLWFEDQRILFGGCFVKSTESTGLGNIADASLDNWGTSVRNVIRKFPRPKYVIPGHMGWAEKGGLQYTLKLLKENKK